ncbi:hypothetical protein AB836_01030 [Rickettsiales bacterium (ex Bugula neritina AB1)]|nr:hypothetical protein AB836_01030 [Rickettsiales bacterium (ex Bugula neritina AB1)]
MGFSTKILNLSTYIVIIDEIDEKDIKLIWREEILENYYYGIEKLNVEIKNVKRKNFMVLKHNNTIEIHYKDKNKFSKIITKNIIYALKDNNKIILKKNISNKGKNAFEFEDNYYIIGEQAIYDSKNFSPQVYMGECIMLAGLLYKKIRETDTLKTCYSTDLIN